jgi:2,4-dienoyl-CoA reductase-like NADH-dependent reductase (Old Yellow Enzyme family)
MAISRREFIKKAGVATGSLAAVSVIPSVALTGCASTGAGAAAGRAAGHRADSPIFEPARIGSLTIKNKMIRAAMAENLHGGPPLCTPTPDLIRMWGDEAAGGIGMVMTGGIGVIREDHSATNFAGFTDLSQMQVYREAADIVHRNGSTLCAQIMVLGTAGTPFAVNTISREDIRRCAAAFAQTVVWLRDAGFDAINYHFAHGYLGGQFWSHWRNARTDEYGGSAENRARFAFEVIEATRRAVGRNFPLTAKINANDHRIQHQGSSQDEVNFYVRGMVERGLDAVEISGTGPGYPIVGDILSKEDHNYFARDARNIARSVSVPMILTGGIRNVRMAEEALRHNSNIVALGMARTILAEPDLPNTWAQNTTHEPQCISCNWCVANIRTFGRTLCILDQNRA